MGDGIEEGAAAPAEGSPSRTRTVTEQAILFIAVE
jgi:hypothetical protein